MKPVLFVFIITCFSVGAFAQTAANQAFEFESSVTAENADKVRLHIFYTASPLLNYRLFTSLQDEPIRLKPRDYVLLESEGQVIDFFRNPAVNNMPLRLNFERGTDYYFRMSRSVDGAWDVNIDEMTERAFQMEIFASNASPKPVVYSFPAQDDLN